MPIGRRRKMDKRQFGGIASGVDRLKESAEDIIAPVVRIWKGYWQEVAALAVFLLLLALSFWVGGWWGPLALAMILYSLVMMWIAAFIGVLGIALYDFVKPRRPFGMSIAEWEEKERQRDRRDRVCLGIGIATAPVTVPVLFSYKLLTDDVRLFVEYEVYGRIYRACAGAWQGSGLRDAYLFFRAWMQKAKRLASKNYLVPFLPIVLPVVAIVCAVGIGLMLLTDMRRRDGR
jgi:hypothetical protein